MISVTVHVFDFISYLLCSMLSSMQLFTFVKRINTITITIMGPFAITFYE